MLQNIEKLIRKDNLKYEIIEDGIIYPLEPSISGSYDEDATGGVLNKDFQFIQLSSQIRCPQISNNNVNKEFYRWNTAPQKIENSNLSYHDETVVYGGILHGAFGHILIESLSRLWYLLDNQSFKIAMIKTGDANTSIWFQFLELFGIDKNNCIIVDKPIQFHKVIIPEQSFCLHGWIHPIYLKIIEKISESVTPKKIRKIYLSRKNIPNYRAIGEKPIEDLFKENGFYTFQPEKISLKEQISYIKGAEEFVTTEGTSSHMALFLNEKSRLICLKRQPSWNKSQILIDKIKNYKYEYIDINFNFLPTNSGQSPCLIGFSKNLKEFCDKNNYYYNETTMFSSLANDILIYLYQSTEFNTKNGNPHLHNEIFEKLKELPYGRVFRFKNYKFSKLLKIHFYYYIHKLNPLFFKKQYKKYFASNTLPEQFLYK